MSSLQRKLLSVEDQLAARPDVDDVFAKNRKLMSLIDKYKSELVEAHREINELKSRLVDTADVKVRHVTSAIFVVVVNGRDYSSTPTSGGKSEEPGNLPPFP